MPDALDPPDEFLPEGLAQEYLAIREDRSKPMIEAKKFYFDRIMPLLQPELERQPAHALLRESKYRTLISLMGFSPETTAMSTIVVKPEKLVIVMSAKAKEASTPAIKYLVRNDLIGDFDYRAIEVRPYDTQHVYDQLLDAIKKAEKPLVIDITGGTKVMSATAGALAWEMNIPICYSDGGWDPKSGSSGLRKASSLTLINNPSRSLGHRFRGDALSNYERGNFVAAAEGFETSRRMILDDSFFDQLGLALCRCYASLIDFDRERVQALLPQVQEVADLGGVRALYDGRLDVPRHLAALNRVAAGDPVAMTAQFAVMADLYARQGRHDFSGLLAYRQMESLVELGLKKIEPDFQMNSPQLKHDFQMKNPQHKLLGRDRAELAAEYAKLSPDGNAAIPERLTLQSGFGLLCLVSDVAKRFSKSGGNKTAVGAMMGFGEIRNRSYLAHGRENLSEDDGRKLRDEAEGLAEAVLESEYAEFVVLREHIRPLPIRQLLSEG